MNEKKLIEAVRQLGRAVELQEVGRLAYGRRENKRRIRDAIEKAYWAVIDANTTAAREQQAQENETYSECETMGCAGIPVTEVRWYDHDELLIAQYCQECADMMKEHHEASVISLKEQNCFEQEPMSIKGWADYASELDRLRLEAIERAERAERERDEAGHTAAGEAMLADEAIERAEGLKRSADELGARLRRATENAEAAEERAERAERERKQERHLHNMEAENANRAYAAKHAEWCRAEAAEHERDELRAAIERHEAEHNISGVMICTSDYDLWAVLSKYQEK